MPVILFFATTDFRKKLNEQLKNAKIIVEIFFPMTYVCVPSQCGKCYRTVGIGAKNQGFVLPLLVNVRRLRDISLVTNI